MALVEADVGLLAEFSGVDEGASRRHLATATHLRRRGGADAVAGSGSLPIRAVGRHSVEEATCSAELR
jgi:hypothetical protein